MSSCRIRFALAGNFEGSPAVKTVSIFWDGKEIGKETFDTTGRTSTAMGWVYKEYTVKATATATPLAFSSLTEDGILMVEIGNERAFAEVAFDGLPMTWVSTSAGDDMVFLVQAQDLRDWLN